MARHGDYDWHPTGEYRWMLEDVQQVIERYRDYWPLTQRSWLYRLMGSGTEWSKAWENHTPSAAAKRIEEGRPLKNSGGGLQLILDRGRRAGLIPWEAVQSKRGTNIEPWRLTSPEGFGNALNATLDHMTVDRQMGQERRVMVCIEADGMVPLLTDVCAQYGVTLVSGQGFDVIGAKRDLAESIAMQGDVLILHLADHDHSGVEIGRALNGDITAWVEMLGGRVEVRPVALTDEQIDRYDLYWEEAKTTGSNHGLGSGIYRWAQLEAFPPQALIDLVDGQISESLDLDQYHLAMQLEAEWKAALAEKLAA